MTINVIFTIPIIFEMSFNTFLVSLFAFAFVLPSYGERLHEQIYSSIEGGAACFRRLNGTHQAGCSSTDNGAVGVAHMIKEVDDAQWMVFNGTAGPYMAVVSTAIFNDVVEILMSQSDNVAGVLLYDNVTLRATAFTQESRCPNEHSSGPGSQCSSSEAGGFVWNEKGTGLLRRDIPFPIFYLPESRVEEIDKIEKCYERYNIDKRNQRGTPQCSIQLNSFMFAAVNTVVCLRRSATSGVLTPTKVCDPLGDHNVYYSLFPRGSKNPMESVTLVTARIDSSSLFDGVSPGAASSVVGMVTLIAAAKALSDMIHVNDSIYNDQNVLWTLLNGESFDYIGSQRVAHDLARGNWPPNEPLNSSQIRLHVEVGQIGGALSQHSNDAVWPLYAFVPYPADTPIPIDDFLNDMSTVLSGSPITLSQEKTTNLPPSSLHSFRRILKNVTESGELPELVLVDHRETFTNKFYQSVLDGSDNIAFKYHNISISRNGTFISTEQLIANGTMKENDTQVKVSRLATVLARTLYKQLVGQSYSGDVAASAHLVDEMFYCFVKSQACRLLLAADYASSGNNEELPERVAPLYVGVAAWASTAPVFAGHLLALLTGQHLNVNHTTCDSMDTPGYSYYWLKGWNHTGVCVETTMNFSQAVSPAFIIPDYEFTSGEYSTWTESVWQAMSARVFVSSGGGGARAAAVGGAFATVVVGLLTYWLRRHASTVFDGDQSAVRGDATAGILRTVNC